MFNTLYAVRLLWDNLYIKELIDIAKRMLPLIVNGTMGWTKCDLYWTCIVSEMNKKFKRPIPFSMVEIKIKWLELAQTYSFIQETIAATPPNAHTLNIRLKVTWQHYQGMQCIKLIQDNLQNEASANPITTPIDLTTADNFYGQKSSEHMFEIYAIKTYLRECRRELDKCVLFEITFLPNNQARVC